MKHTVLFGRKLWTVAGWIAAGAGYLRSAWAWWIHGRDCVTDGLHSAACNTGQCRVKQGRVGAHAPLELFVWRLGGLVGYV